VWKPQVMKRHMKTSYALVLMIILSIQPLYAISLKPENNPLLHKSPRKNIYHIGVNFGPAFYFGDLKNNFKNAPFYYNFGAQVNAERDIFNATRLCINFFGGSILGEEETEALRFNFKTTILAPQIGLSFNILHWANRERLRERFTMNLNLGIEAVFFSVAGDLKNAAGETYYYWDDGSIRNMPETYFNHDEARIIQRDYKYETDYSHLDLDNVGKIPHISYGIPVGMSFDVKFKNGIFVRAGATYHYTFTDYLDNITVNSIGNRKGNSAPDSFIYTYAGIYYTIPIVGRQSDCGTKKMNTSRITRKKHKFKK